MATEWQFFPDSPKVYHLLNVLLFSLTCWVLFFLFCRLFKKHNYNLILPFISTMLFVAHPIHTEVVNSIKSIDEICCLLFALLSIFSFIKAIETKSTKHLILANIFYFLCLLSKETGISFLIIIPMILYVFSIVENKRIISIIVMLIGVTSLFFGIRFMILKSFPSNNYFLTQGMNSLVSAPDFISQKATAFYVLFRYILLLIIPYPLCYNYTFAQIPIQSINNWMVMASLVTYIGIGIYSIINVLKKNIVAFAILFYLLTLVPVSNIFILIGSPMAERFLYIPSIGFCMLLSLLLIKLTNSNILKTDSKSIGTFYSSNSILLIITFTIVFIFSLTTFARSKVWKNDVTLYGHDVETAPLSASAHYCWGLAILQNIYPQETDSTLKISYLNKAINEFKLSINILPYYDAVKNLAKCYGMIGDLGNYKIALSKYRDLIFRSDMLDTSEINSLSISYYNLGHQYSQAKQYDKAIPFYDSALKYKPNFSEAYNNKSVALLNTKNYDEAIAVSDMAIKLDEKNVKAYVNKGCAYSNLKQFDKALEYFNKAIVINPNEHDAYYFMGVTCFNMGDKERAKTYFDKAELLKK
ncbi:MAG: tetratricopeptide repeat protein [Bacteroidota bacterium]